MIGGIYKDIKADQSCLLLIPEIRQMLKAKQTKAEQQRLYFLENQAHFSDLLNLNENERKEKAKEIRKEIDKITIMEREMESKSPLYRIKEEKQIDKKSWKNYNFLMRV